MLRHLLLTLSILILLTACGNSPQMGVETNTTALTNGQSEDPSQQQNTEQWNKVSFDGFPQGGSFFNKLVVKIDKVKKTLVMTLPIPLIPLIQFPEYQIPEIPGAKVSFEQQTDGTKLIKVEIPLTHIVRGIELNPGTGTLPNGDALPGFPDGEMPGTTVSIPGLVGWNMHIYVGAEASAVFIEVPGFTIPGDIGGFLPSQLTYPIKNSDKTKILGYLSYVAPKGTYAGGAYIAAQLPKDLAALLDTLLP